MTAQDKVWLSLKAASLMIAVFALEIAQTNAGAFASEVREASKAAQPLVTEYAFAATSKVGFKVTIFGVFQKKGTFERLSGTITLREDMAKVNAKIAATSVVMKSRSDAELLMSPPYFDAKRHPEISFVSGDFATADLTKGGALIGDLTLRGVTHRQTFTLKPMLCEKSQKAGIFGCGFLVSGSLQRSEYGLLARKGIVGDQVQLVLSITVPE